MHPQPGEFTDIAELAWSSNPITDEDMIAERDRIRFLVGHVLRGAPDLGGERAMAVSWIGIACAIVDAMPAPQLYAHLHSLPPAFQRALEAAATAARVADHNGRDRDWLDRYREALENEVKDFDKIAPADRRRDAWDRNCEINDLLRVAGKLYGSTGQNVAIGSNRSSNTYTRNLESIRAMTWFQESVRSWVLQCFGAEIAGDVIERNHRFLEEALELVKACGCTQSEAHQLVDYVYGRPVGDKAQEVGGVMVTLAALVQSHGISMAIASFDELERINGKVEEIRAKQAAKPKHSPLPEAGGPADGQS